MKRLFVALLLVMTLCCACSKRDDKEVIQFASWGSQSEIAILKPIIAEYERKNSDVKIEFMHIPQNYFQKIHLLLASNMAPDVIFMNNLYLPVYANFLEDIKCLP